MWTVTSNDSPPIMNGFAKCGRSWPSIMDHGRMWTGMARFGWSWFNVDGHGPIKLVGSKMFLPLFGKSSFFMILISACFHFVDSVNFNDDFSGTAYLYGPVEIISSI